jgi:hypothetical protein
MMGAVLHGMQKAPVLTLCLRLIPTGITSLLKLSIKRFV